MADAAGRAPSCNHAQRAAHDLGVVPGAVAAMSLSFASNEILGLITHDKLEEDAFST